MGFHKPIRRRPGVHVVTLLGNWTTDAGSYSPPRFYRRARSSKVVVEGGAGNATDSPPSTMFTLPIGFRSRSAGILGHWPVANGGVARGNQEDDGDFVAVNGSLSIDFQVGSLEFF